jgi:hypothetical protein
MPRRALPPSARRACRRVLHPSRVEGRTPAALVVAGELKVVALVRHADDDPADAGPRVEPGPERPEGAVIRGAREGGEAECGSQKLAPLVEHGYSITWSARSRSDCGIVSPSAFAVLRLITSSNFVACSTGRSAGLAPLRILSSQGLVDLGREHAGRQVVVCVSEASAEGQPSSAADRRGWSLRPLPSAPPGGGSNGARRG